MTAQARRYERVRCPGCDRVIAAYVPIGGDGSGLRLVFHKRHATRPGACAYADRLIVRDGGTWRLEL